MPGEFTFRTTPTVLMLISVRYRSFSSFDSPRPDSQYTPAFRALTALKTHRPGVLLGPPPSTVSTARVWRSTRLYIRQGHMT